MALKTEFNGIWDEYRKLCEMLDIEMIHLQDDWISHYREVKAMASRFPLMRMVRLRDLVNNVRELESDSNSENWTAKITAIRLLVEQYADEIEEESEAKSIEEIEEKLQCLQDEFENRDSELDGHCQSKRLKLLTEIKTLKWVLNRATSCQQVLR